ncbi:MAG: lysophospholipid acyltransferase family protein [Pseudomonadota bacterium]
MTAFRSYLYAAYMVATTVLLAAVLWPTLLMRQRDALFAIRLWARTMLGGLKAICGLGWRTLGAERRPTGAALIASNHQSQWETIALCIAVPRPAFVLKSELMRVPIIGWWAARAGMIPIERDGGAASLRGLISVAKRRLAEGRQIIIFPEGTRTAPGQTTDYKPGAAALYSLLKIACTPVAHDSGRYWRHPGFRREPGDIRLSFLPEIAPGLRRPAFEDALRHAIRQESANLSPAAAGPVGAHAAEAPLSAPTPPQAP